MARGYYALYKGDLELASGTIKEIAKKMGVNESTIRYYKTGAYRRKAKGDAFNRRCLIKLD